MMHEDYMEPSIQKMIDFEQLDNYCTKYNKTLDNKLLKLNNFNILEINWLKKYRKEKIKMTNEKIIKQLKEHIKYLETKLENMEEKKERSITYNKLKDEWVVVEIYGNRINKHYIDADNIMEVWDIIRKNTTREYPYLTYRFIVKEIIERNNLKVGLDAFNGGKNRAKYLWPKYYYPLKILQHLKLIKYNGGGVTTRLSFGVKKYADMIR